MSLDFKIISKKNFLMDPEKVKGGTFIHLCSVSRRNKLYIAYRKVDSHKCWIEEFSENYPGYFKEIEDDNEFHDIAHFMLENKLLKFEKGGEILVG